MGIDSTYSILLYPIFFIFDVWNPISLHLVHPSYPVHPVKIPLELSKRLCVSYLCALCVFVVI
jgi:hypothetical protein